MKVYKLNRDKETLGKILENVEMQREFKIRDNN